MIELGEKEATVRMLSLNASNAEKRQNAKWRPPLAASSPTVRNA